MQKDVELQELRQQVEDLRRELNALKRLLNRCFRQATGELQKMDVKQAPRQ